MRLLRFSLREMLPLARWLYEYRHPVAAWVVLRCMTIAAVIYAISFSDPGTTVQVPGYQLPAFSGLGETLFGAWMRADALWYLKISTQGYEASDGSLAFFPVYPLMIALLRPLFLGNEAIAALFLSSVATLVGMVLLFRVVSVVFHPRLGRAAVWGLALLPTSFFLMAPYAEGLFVMLGGGAMLAAHRRKVLPMVLAGALAALCRPFGLLLAIPLVFLFSEKSTVKSVVTAAGGPLFGSVVWLGFSAVVTGDPFGGLSVQQRWQRELALPWNTIVDGLQSWWSYRTTEYGPYFLLDAGALLFGSILIGLVMLRLPSPRIRSGLGAYGAAVMIVPLASVFPGRPLLSLPRFLLALFPLFGILGVVPIAIQRILALLGAVGVFALTVAFVSARPIF